ncbi:hypothetical protein AZE42_13243, partial [Rhizopogon vesiculosus]
MLGTWCP